jgi:hypothetical protein
MPVFPSTFLAEIDPSHHNFQEKEIRLASFPDSLTLEINANSFLKTKELSRIFYSFYNELLYLFNYLNYQVKFPLFEINKTELQDYFELLYLSPFL